MGRRLTPYELLLRSVPESDLQGQCQQVAELIQVPYFHDNDPRRNFAGLPDTLIPVAPVLCLWELKTEAGKLRPEQVVWGEVLQACTKLDYRVVRPSTIAEDLDWLLRTARRIK